MQADANALVFNRFAIIQRLEADIPTETDAKQFGAVAMRQIMPVSPPCMVAVRMRDHSPIHRPPGIDEKFALGTVQTFRAAYDQGKCHPGIG